MWIFLYLVPLGILLWFVYSDMRKGETIEQYLNRCDLDDVFWVLTFFPAFNWLMALFVIIDVTSKAIWNKIKYWKK